MAKESVLQFIHYTVDEIQFKRLSVESRESPFALEPAFRRRLTKSGDNEYDLLLSIEIDSTEERPAPFALKVSLTGHFLLKEDEPIDDKMKKALLLNNTSAILFPLLRSTIAAVTANTNMPPLILPVLNFSGNMPEEQEL